jgi:hypothetical protein
MLKDRYATCRRDVPTSEVSPARLMHRKRPQKPAANFGHSHTSTSDHELGLRMPRSDTAASRATIATFTTSSSEDHAEFKTAVAEGTLDTLTLIRSALALASEQDPSILLCTLLRILCQFIRADYGGIAFFDETDPSIIHLRAAGHHHSIVPYELNISDESCQKLCPAAIITQVARSGLVSHCRACG